MPKKQKPKAEKTVLKPFVAENNQTANEYLTKMMSALDAKTKQTLKEAKTEDVKTDPKEDSDNELPELLPTEEYEGGD